MENVILQELRLMAEIPNMNQRQRKYFVDTYNIAKPVSVVHASAVFTLEELRIIEECIKPERKMCYMNAYMLCQAFPDKVTYCEGKVNCLFPIDHAFNRVGDKFVDITFEFALKDEHVIEYDYVVFGDYNTEQVDYVADKIGYYGGVYSYYFHHQKECPQLSER